MSNLASTYRNQRRWKEAEELQVQVVETRKRILGPDHPDTLNSMANLSSIYQDQRRLKEAEEVMVQVMETRKQLLGPEHPVTLNSMSNLASIYRDRERWKEAIMNCLPSFYQKKGRYKEAEELRVQVMETWKQLLGPGHPDTLNSMSDLASI
jgi:tetratricopeptide (TPR) repeat protein